MVEPAFSITRPMARAISHQMASRHGGGDELDGLDPAYWQATAPADSAGDANTMSQLWAGAITSTTFRCSAKLSASAAAVRLVISEQSDMSSGLFYSKEPVASANGHAKPIVQGLVANRTYYWGLLVDGVLKTNDIGRFKTLPNVAALSFRAGVASCSNNNTATSFEGIKAANALFMVHMGDKHYQDVNTTNIADHLAGYDDIFEVEAPAGIVDFYSQVPSFHSWSDHDFCGDGSYSASTGKGAAQQAFRAKVPHPALEVADGIYYSFKIGRCVFVMLDARSFRSDPAATDNSSKTVLGATQKQWFKDLLVDPENDGCVFFPIFDEPWDATASDTWGVFTTERAELAAYILAQGLGFRIAGLSGGAHCFAIDGGEHTVGNFPIMNAAPLSQTNSSKGLDPYDIGPDVTSEQQYGLLDVVDDGGDIIEVTFSGFTGAGAAIGTKTVYLSPTVPVPVQIKTEQGAAGFGQTLNFTAPASGNRLVLYVGPDKGSGAIATPAGWSVVGTQHSGTGVSGAMFTKVSDGTETSVAVTWANSVNGSMTLVELKNAGAVDQFGIATGQSGTPARTSGVITAGGAIAEAAEIALSFVNTDSGSSTDAATAHGWSSDFVEVKNMGMGNTNWNVSSSCPSVSVGRKLLPAIGTPSTEFTWNGDATDEAMGMLVTVRPAA